MSIYFLEQDLQDDLDVFRPSRMEGTKSASFLRPEVELLATYQYTEQNSNVTSADRRIGIFLVS